MSREDDDFLDFGPDVIVMPLCPEKEYDDLLSWDLDAESVYPVSNLDANAIDPNTLVDEARKHYEAGRNPMRYDSVVAHLNIGAYEEFNYWLNAYNLDQDYVSRTLAVCAVNYLRVGVRTLVVKSATNDFIADAEVIGATPDGKEVKLLFPLPPNYIKRYANCKRLPRMAAHWFNVKTGACHVNGSPFSVSPGQ